MKHLIQIISVFGFATAGCAVDSGVGSSSHSILYGEAEDTHDGVVHLRMGRASDNQCTGTVISHNAVLTSASCIEAAEGAILLAEHGLQQTDFEYSTEVWLPHPDYNGAEQDPALRAQNDIAVVVFDQPFPWLTPIRVLDGELDVVEEGDPLTLVGFGQDEEGRKTGDRLSTQNELADLYESSFTVEDASTNGGNLCHNDQGGPALFRGSVVGVASSFEVDGDGGCEPGIVFNDAVSYFARVDIHKRWIRDQINAYDDYVKEQSTEEPAQVGGEKADGVESAGPSASEPAACAAQSHGAPGLALPLLGLLFFLRRRSVRRS